MDHPRITQNPRVMFGKPCIKGRLITVEMIRENLSDVRSAERVAKDYDVTLEDVHAALAYAADCLHEEVAILVAAE